MFETEKDKGSWHVLIALPTLPVSGKSCVMSWKTSVMRLL